MTFVDIKLFGLYVFTSIKSSLSLRESFLLQTFFMMLSNLIFFSFWWIYFTQFDSVKGWTISDMACLYGIVSGAYGCFTVFFGGAKFISRIIYDGDLDAMIVKPKNLLIQIISSKSIPAGWGDIISSVFMLSLSGYVNIWNVSLIILLIISSTMIILAFAIIVGSLGFWIENSHSLSKQIFEFLLTFSNYPKTIYVGGIQFILLTLLPSGFIGYMPVDIIREYSFSGLFIILAASFIYMLLAVKVFMCGLKNYKSGNKLGM